MFSKSFPKVFDETPKGAICVMKTKKRKGRGPFCTYGEFLNGTRRGNGGIGCTKGREARPREAAAGRLIREIV